MGIQNECVLRNDEVAEGVSDPAEREVTKDVRYQEFTEITLDGLSDEQMRQGLFLFLAGGGV